MQWEMNQTERELNARLRSLKIRLEAMGSQPRFSEERQDERCVVK